MKNFEQYRINPRNFPTTTARETGLAILKQIRKDPGNDLKTSITLPTWQYARFRQLVEIYKERGYSQARQAVLHDLMLLLNRKIRRKKCQARRTKRRNTKEYSYKKVSVQFTPKQYNVMHALADHSKMSVSFLFDLALRLYFDVLAQEGDIEVVVLRKSEQKKLLKKLRGDTFRKIMALGGIYKRNTVSSTPNKLKYQVSVEKPPSGQPKPLEKLRQVTQLPKR